MERWPLLSDAEVRAVHALAFYATGIDDPCVALSVEALQNLSRRMRNFEQLIEQLEAYS